MLQCSFSECGFRGQTGWVRSGATFARQHVSRQGWLLSLSELQSLACRKMAVSCGGVLRIKEMMGPFQVVTSLVLSGRPRLQGPGQPA